MNTSAAPARPPRRHLAFAALLGLAIFLPGIGNRDLWNPDEPRYAEVAREMVLSGQYFVPHLNGTVYTQKPPLQFWAMSLASLLTGGVNEAAARLPAVVSAAATLVLLLLLGSRLFNPRTGWLAAAVFASMVAILWQGRIGQIDMQLIFWVSLSVWLWVRGETEGRPLFYRLFFVAAGCATLAKGPAGFLPPLLAILAFYAWAGDRAGYRRLRPWLGLGIWALVVLAWLVPAGLVAGREYLDQIVLKQNVTRYADPWHHRQPFYYYLTNLLSHAFPWTFVLPAVLVVGWRRFVRDRDAPGRPGFLFAACWVGVTLLFFSLSPAKRSVYMLTMFPGLALAVAAVLDRLAAEWPRERRWLSLPLGLLTGLLGGAAVALVPATAGRPELALLPASLPTTAALCLGLWALGCGIAFGLALADRPISAVVSVAAGTVLSVLGLVLTILPAVNPLKSVRPLAERFRAEAAAGEPYAVYPRLDAPVLFYTGRFAVWPQDEAELRAFATAPGKRWLFIEVDDLAKLDPPLAMTEVARGPDPKDGYALLAKEE